MHARFLLLLTLCLLARAVLARMTSSDVRLTMLQRRLERTELDLAKLELRIDAQFDDLRTFIKTALSNAETDEKKDDGDSKFLSESVNTMVQESIQRQSATLFRGLAAEKRHMRSMQNEIRNQFQKDKTEAKVYNQELKTGIMEDKTMYQTVVNTSIASMKAEMQTIRQLQDRVTFQCKKDVLEVTGTFAANITALDGRIQDIHSEQLNRVSNLNAKFSDAITKTNAALESKTSSNSNSVLLINKRLGTHAAFSARLKDGTSLRNHPKSTKIVLDSSIYNEGNHYDTSTGEFTAPASGVYLFTFNVESIGQDNQAHIELRVNGKYVVDAVAQAWHIALTGGNSAVTHVSKGNKVWLQTASHKDSYHIWSSRTRFNGVLLYLD